jgi:predicted nicotinamide N-methyase
VPEELVSRTVELPSGELGVLQPRESAELPDDGPVEWAPLVPYWSALWRSGVALAREVDGETLAGLRVVELGCGLALPSIAAARRGAMALATDACAEALALAERNARANGVPIETARFDWAKARLPDEPACTAEPPGAGQAVGPRAARDLAQRGPFDLLLAADVLYERASVAPLLSLLPRLAAEAWLADPGRAAAAAFLEEASRRWAVDTRVRGVVRIHRLRLA